jgi:hypothetical protein
MKTSISSSQKKKKTYQTPVLKMHGTVRQITKLGKLGSELDLGNTFNYSE